MNHKPTVAIVGLGYVGLPLALAFGKKFDTIGFDVSKEKIAAYRAGSDPTGEMPDASFKAAASLRFSNDPSVLREADRVVVAVPTPIDSANRPDMTALVMASETVGKNLRKGAIVIFESTVYPGVTEEICGPVLERTSGLRCGVDFKLGYSPERINPGDKEHTLEKIIKVVAGQDAESSAEVSKLYASIVEAGVHEASSIKVAEAAKVIENTQRDLNIALMNELAIIFHRLGIDTEEVLKAAGTKWNFLPFRPGLVGGHCIGVDPYYLTHKAEMVGYHPQVILAGRRINDSMGAFVASETVKKIVASGRPLNDAKVLLMGLTFKENVGDLRNSKVIDIYNELRSYGVSVEIWDPVANPREAEHEYGVKLLRHWSDLSRIDAVVAAVPHREVKSVKLEDLARVCGKGAAFIDVKCAFEPKALRELGFTVWRL